MDWESIYLRLTRDGEDTLAWHALARRIECWARAVFRGRGHSVVEDVVAETCASVALGIAGARGPETFSGFVYGHFLNVRRRALRADSFSQSYQSLDGIEIPAEGPSDDPDPDAIALLRRALACLPERERRAVTLRYFNELPSACIAAELGVTHGNARRIVFNGLRRLRSQLRPTSVEARGSIGSAFGDAQYVAVDDGPYPN
jgi:RNA polymerase sigma factor (sigma-70 family)